MLRDLCIFCIFSAYFLHISAYILHIFCNKSAYFACWGLCNDIICAYSLHRTAYSFHNLRIWLDIICVWLYVSKCWSLCNGIFHAYFMHLTVYWRHIWCIPMLILCKFLAYLCIWLHIPVGPNPASPIPGRCCTVPPSLKVTGLGGIFIRCLAAVNPANLVCVNRHQNKSLTPSLISSWPYFPNFPKIIGGNLSEELGRKSM